MFNNIIYFIVVLLIYTVGYPDKTPKVTFNVFFGMLLITWAVFAAYCRWEFLNLLKRSVDESVESARLTVRYQRLTGRLCILSICLFALVVYLLDLKYWIRMIPGAAQFSVLEGSIALLLFFCYLSTIWYFASPAYRIIFRQRISKVSFVLSNVRLNLPILFPWLGLSFVYDLMALSPWGGPDGVFGGIWTNVAFFAGFIILLMIYMPFVIQYWWGCKPFESSGKVQELKTFLRQNDFKYRNLVEWPIFEGRMMTAGIMGIVARYRYILVTDSLMEILTTDELKAVLAHEMGHIKYRHLIFYILFFVGFMVISIGLQDVLLYVLSLFPFFPNMILGENPQSGGLFYLTLSIAMLLILIVYFRYIMGFFMRNFERQADLYSARIMGSPNAIVRSLEKIALLSGKTEDIPSWHHFSIRQRIDCLKKSHEDPNLFRRHNRFLMLSFFVYLLGVIALGYTLNSSPLKGRMFYLTVSEMLQERLSEEPKNIGLLQNLAMLYHENGEYEKAKATYEKVLTLDPDVPSALNNLAWLLITAPDETLQDRTRALDLAKRAVAHERSAVFLDTLAEAYYRNGFIPEAVKTSEEAIASAKENRAYYRGQLKKYLSE